MVMKRIVSFFLISIFLVLGGTNLFPQESWVENLRIKAFDLVEKEKFNEAIALLEDAVGTAKQKYGELHKTFADISLELAVVYYLVDELENAKEHLQRALRIYELSSDQDPILIASTHIKLAELYENQENLSQAAFHMKKAIKNYKKVVDPNDPVISDLEHYLRTSLEPEPSQEKESGEIEDWDEYFFGDKPKKEPPLTERQKLQEKERVTEKVIHREAEKETPSRELRKERVRNNSFEIIAIEGPEVFEFDKKDMGMTFPTMTVTYRLHTTKDQANWVERFDVVCPDGKILYAGGGTRYYFYVPQQSKQMYTVNGYCTEKGRGTYKFRLTLEGEDLITQMIERSFKLR